LSLSQKWDPVSDESMRDALFRDDDVWCFGGAGINPVEDGL